MVIFKPFPGYRPVLKDGESIDDRISPPYDVISPEELRKLQSRPGNVTRITLRSVDGNYHEARKELDSWISEGLLQRDDDCFYLYEQAFKVSEKEYLRSGIVGVLKTEPYSEGNIIPHEETFPKVKEDRLKLLRDTETHCESIFGISEGLDEELQRDIAAVAEPVYETVDNNGVTHRLSLIRDDGVKKRIEDALRTQRILIADGHHRFETACSYGEENPDKESKQYVLATLVASNDPGLVVWPTHRLIRCRDFQEEPFISSLNEELETIECDGIKDMEYQMSQGADIGIILRSGRTFVAYVPEEDDPLRSLDTYVAQERIMNGILGRDNIDVDYEASLKKAEERMKTEDYDLAIVFNPPRMEKIWSVSLQGKRMPKKSTYFFPKIWSGFVYYRMD
ncbi:MAG: hypothetical protein PWQ88_509 [Candidatus Methanomethylophilaceae archaeon]|nr:hypothetical protein [Candidatus Methanomethylophilaceae archaeon]MDI3541421.1 hypothetical protein [Candidatus Methanomethylophilaceae archaeon]HIJ00786.1 DUF1015 domain-containing protein [Candidatus Methanomethylophilaceae archaeon]